MNYDIDEDDAGFGGADFDGSGMQSDAATAGVTARGNSNGGIVIAWDDFRGGEY